MIASAVKYMAMGVAAVSLLLLAAGYFGSKLQSLEAIAVVQVTALLLLTVENTGPTYEGLSNLSYSLGVTALFGRENYYYEDSELPIHVRTLIQTSSSFQLINVFLMILMLPILTGMVLKILAKTVYKESVRVDKSWKYAIASFTYYGILFLAYGELACLALNIRYFKADMNCLISIGIGVIFTAMLTAWVIASAKHPNWFGCFKKKFRKFELASYYYTF